MESKDGVMAVMGKYVDPSYEAGKRANEILLKSCNMVYDYKQKTGVKDKTKQTEKEDKSGAFSFLRSTIAGIDKVVPGRGTVANFSSPKKKERKSG